jgi:hypothetical protein
LAKDSTSQLLVRALAISLVLHLVCFGTWKYGQTHGWWRESHLPAWLQNTRSKLVSSIAKKLPPPAPKVQTPPQTLMFVDVDPTLAVTETPKNAKFTSSANTVASSTKKAESELPELTGQQEKVLKTTENNKPKSQPIPEPQPVQPTLSKAKPLQPSPKVREAEKPAPAPKAYTPGDLAIAKPRGKANDSKSEEPEAAAPPRRPKTVAEAKAMRGITGEKMKNVGGGPKVGMNSSLDVRRTVTGDYDRIFVDAVQERWDFLLQSQSAATPVGEVRVEFKLHYDGRITDMKVVRNSVSDFYSLLCQKAILDNSPYARWSPEMRRELAGDTREVTFTFFYQ